MKKQGFTLIELMVVVVIIGILAAVAVPKLFGMIAKSKASEVGPAAGTYVKLQQAYFSENNKIGGWTLIGYTAPADGETTNFYYGAGVAHNTESQEASDVIGFAADNKITLNNCAAGNAVTAAKQANVSGTAHWMIKVSVNTNNASDVTFTPSVANSGTVECLPLTPSFEKIK